MPVSVVVGGQFGSEGKGKVALHLARQFNAKFVVRVGGPNSGHTGVDRHGKEWVFRQLPASSLNEGSVVVLPAGSLIDPEILQLEIERLGLSADRIVIDEMASAVLERHRAQERSGGLIESIGSTGSGSGAALQERLARKGDHLLARDHPFLRKFTVPSTTEILRAANNQNQRVIIEGTQGHGLSVWHGRDYPNVTTRDTSAGTFVAESGLSPMDVDQIALVLRSYPIRVHGQSGPLPNELSWEEFNAEVGLPTDYRELTSVTRKVRRIALFDEAVVKSAIQTNNPSHIFMNHLDYVEKDGFGSASQLFLRHVEETIGRRIDMVGYGPNNLVDTQILQQRRMAN